MKLPSKAEPDTLHNASLGPRFLEAVVYAARLHGSQMRKKTTRLYIAHLLSVASIVLQYGGDEDQAIAALLHDAVEDAGGLPTLEAIRKKFGERVARIVDGCSDSYTMPKPPWLERKKQYVARIQSEPADVRLVSAADKLSNARETLMDYRALGENVWERFTGGREGTLWYYSQITNAFRAAGSNALVEELNRVVSELERLVREPRRAH